MVSELSAERSEPKGSQPFAERTSRRLASRRVVRLGRVRVPLAGPYAPWATIFRMPDGRLLATIRLWEVDRAVRRCLPAERLLAYARRSGLLVLAATLESWLEEKGGPRCPHA